MPRGKTPTEDQVARMRELRAAGTSEPEISRLTGIPKSTVHVYVADMGKDVRAATIRARAEIPPGWLPRARALLGAGVSKNEIAAQIGVAKSSVYRMLEKFGTK